MNVKELKAHDSVGIAPLQVTCLKKNEGHFDQP
jgi:hypothetical protein